jgi:hypothetical protein
MKTVPRLLACNRTMFARVDYHFVATDWYFHSFFTEDIPEFLDEGTDSILEIDGHVVFGLL